MTPLRMKDPMRGNRLGPLIAIAATIGVTMLLLHLEGRLWFCSREHFQPWVGQPRSPETSQHLLDPYSFTHFQHGLLLYWLLAWLLPRWRWPWRAWLGIAIESLWEVIENSPIVIRRYREATAALGYFGDTILNSLGDILVCGTGFWLAGRIGFRGSALLFLVIEFALVIWIRDSLLLSVIMLFYPMDWLKAWQMGG